MVMKTSRCGKICRLESIAPAGNDRSQQHRSRLVRRCLDVAKWIVPGALLAFMPKCPICLAAYVAAATGLGLSFTNATYLRTVLLLLSIVSLFYLAAKQMRRFIGTPREKAIAL